MSKQQVKKCEQKDCCQSAEWRVWLSGHLNQSYVCSCHISDAALRMGMANGLTVNIKLYYGEE